MESKVVRTSQRSWLAAYPKVKAALTYRRRQQLIVSYHHALVKTILTPRGIGPNFSYSCTVNPAGPLQLSTEFFTPIHQTTISTTFLLSTLDRISRAQDIQSMSYHPTSTHAKELVERLPTPLNSRPTIRSPDTLILLRPTLTCQGNDILFYRAGSK